MIPILETKIRLPELTGKRLARPKLVQRLNLGLEQGKRITLVSAPAGFGKTDVIVEWLHETHLPAAWLSLDSTDDEPGRFYLYLLTALQKLDPTLGTEFSGLLRAGQLPPDDILTASLINGISQLAGKSVLVLDDVHLLQDHIILKTLSSLLAHIPSNFHLVLITREDPPMPLGKIRASNQLMELRGADLRFTAEESRQLLNGVIGLSLAPEEIAALENRTEGWIVGLQLAGMILKDRSDTSSVIGKIHGSQKFILNYLTEEVLNRQSIEIQEFLLGISILEQFSPGLCDAVVGRNDSTRILEYIDRTNLFLIPLDESRSWFRFHHLFRDLLREQLSSRYPNQSKILHQRASSWYQEQCHQTNHPGEQYAYVSRAVRHSIAAADFAYAVQLIERYAMGMIVEWYAKDLNQWSQMLPADWRMKTPRTNLAFAWHFLLNGNFQKAMPYLEQLGKYYPPDLEGLDPALKAELLALEVWILSAQGQVNDAYIKARQAMVFVSSTDPVTRSLVYLAYGNASMLVGKVSDAIETYRHLLQTGRTLDHHPIELIATATIGQLLIFSGKYRETYTIISSCIDRMEQLNSIHPISIAIYGELAEIYYQWNDVEKSRLYLNKALDVSTLSGYPHAAVFHHLLNSRWFRRENKPDEAASELQKAVKLSPGTIGGSLREEVIAEQVTQALRQNRVSEAETIFMDLGPRWTGFQNQGNWILPRDYFQRPGVVENPEARSLTIALRINLYHIWQHFDLTLTQNGIQFATDLIASLKNSGFVPLILETLLLRSQHFQAIGDVENFHADLIEAIRIAEPEGILGIFLQEDESFLEKLRTINPINMDPQIRRHLQTIQSYLPATKLISTKAFPSTPSELLTIREMDVLRLMVSGKTYEDMARELYLTINTVRSHVKRIYGRLGVNNRTAAIEEARLRHLI